MKSAILIDGGHLRHLVKKAGFEPTPDFIEAFVHTIVDNADDVLRAYYYDCRPYNGRQIRPISGEEIEYSLHSGWMDELARRNLFQLRLGHLKFRGWVFRDDGDSESDLTDEHFVPSFEQKSVDLMIAMDIADLVESKAVDRLVFVTGDTDLAPVLNHARTKGLSVDIANPPGWQLHDILQANSDTCRDVAWPGDGEGFERRRSRY